MMYNLIFRLDLADKYLNAFREYYTKTVLGDNVILGSNLVKDQEIEDG